MLWHNTGICQNKGQMGKTSRTSVVYENTDLFDPFSAQQHSQGPPVPIHHYHRNTPLKVFWGEMVAEADGKGLQPYSCLQS